MVHSKRSIIYICLVFVLLVLPFAGMLFLGSSESTQAEKRDLAEFPKLTSEEGSLNPSFLSDMGTYFEDHFAFRNALVTANGAVKQNVLGSMPGDEVIIGRDGWLFYSGTLDDYFRRDPMTPRELFITAHNLRLLQDYCEERGARFVFVIAANKNSIYPEYMPGNYLEGVGQTNAMALLPYLEKEGVTCCDMHEAFDGQDEILYYRTDSHWTDKGAALGFDRIMETLGLPAPDFAQAEFVIRRDQQGDLEEMLLPQGEYYEDCPRIVYDWQSDAPLDEAGREAVLIETTNPQASGSLVMYRDSFGTALVPFFAECFGEALFSRSSPYPMNDVNQCAATDVIIEKAERNLIDLAILPAIMPAPVVETSPAQTKQTAAEIDVREEKSLVQIHGSVPVELVTEDTRMYIAVDGIVHEAFLSTNSEREGNDCYIYLGKSQLEHKSVELQLMIGEIDAPVVVASKTCQLTGGNTSELSDG